MIWLALTLTAAANPFETRVETPNVDVEIETPDRIINGVVEDGYPAAVGLGTGGYTACSGSIITPRLVLTAAHCGGDLPVELIVQFGDTSAEPVAPPNTSSASATAPFTQTTDRSRAPTKEPTISEYSSLPKMHPSSRCGLV